MTWGELWGGEHWSHPGCGRDSGHIRQPASISAEFKVQVLEASIIAFQLFCFGEDFLLSLTILVTDPVFFKNFIDFRERGREREIRICCSAYLSICWLLLLCALTGD